MALIATVTSPVSLQALPTRIAKSLDKLSPGDRITILPFSQWPDIGRVAADWSYGRISYIKNGVYAAERTHQTGWFYTAGTCSISDDSPQQRLPTIPAHYGLNLPPWLWLPATLVIIATATWLLWR